MTFENGKGTFEGMESYEPNSPEVDDGFFDDDAIERDVQGEEMLERVREGQASEVNSSEITGEGRTYKTIDGEEFILWGFEDVTPERGENALFSNSMKLEKFNETFGDALKSEYARDSKEFLEGLDFYEKQLGVIEQEMVDRGLDLNTAYPDLRRQLDSFDARKNMIKTLKEYPEFAEDVIENLKSDEEINKEASKKKEVEETKAYRAMLEVYETAREATPEFQEALQERKAFEKKIEDLEIDIALREYDAELLQQEMESINPDSFEGTEKAAAELHKSSLKYELEQQKISAEFLRSQKAAAELEFIDADKSLRNEEKDTLKLERLNEEAERVKNAADRIKVQAEYALEWTPLKVEMSPEELQEEVLLLEQIYDNIQLEIDASNARTRAATVESLKAIHGRHWPIVDFYRGKIGTRLNSRKAELESKKRIASVEKQGAVIIDPDYDLKILDEVERRVDIEEIKSHLNEKEQQLPKDSGIEMSIKRQMRDLQRDLDKQMEEYQEYMTAVQRTQNEINQKEAQILELGGDLREEAQGAKGFFGKLREVFSSDSDAEIARLKKEISQLKENRQASLLMIDDTAPKVAFYKGAIKYLEMNAPAAEQEKIRQKYLDAQEANEQYKDELQNAA